MEDGLIPRNKPFFFKEIPHPWLENNDRLDTKENYPLFYEFIEGTNKGYWERREKQDWEDMPNLWGPFEDE